MPKFSRTYEEAVAFFWQRVPIKKKGCWLWPGATIKTDATRRSGISGYGQFRSRYFPTALAHRVAWIIAHGVIPEGMQVCHTCDNPLCVRPTHLFLGTQKDNEADKKKKGRAAIGDRSPRRRNPDSYKFLAGDTHPNTKLTIVQKELIAKTYVKRSKGSDGATALAKKYGVSQTLIHLVARKYK